MHACMRATIVPLRPVAFATQHIVAPTALSSRFSLGHAHEAHHCPCRRPRAFLATPASLLSRPSDFLGARLPTTRTHALATPATAPPTFKSATKMAAQTDALTRVRVLLAVADGSEEIEAATVADVLVRAGAAVTIAAAGGRRAVRMSRGLVVEADALVEDVARDHRDYDLVVLPGGMPGAEHLRDCKQLETLLRAAAADPEGPVIGAICAAPAVVLAHYGLLGSRDATCYPAPKFVQMLHHLSEGDVVVSADRRFITSRGPATAMPFALALVERLYGKPLADKLSKELLLTV
jgi:protein deglycase